MTTVTLDLARVDTIAALATPQGAGAVAVVRVSGPASERIRDRVFRPRRPAQFRPAALRLGDVVSDGAAVDEALCAWFAPGHSYTGEAALELHIHGGVLNSRAVLEAVLAAGARLAEPGEFSLRAFLNGRMDLAQAEAVQQIVGAQSHAALTLAQRALRGVAGQALEPLRLQLTDLLAELEARLDFPDEDLSPAVLEQVAASADGLRLKVVQQRATAGSAARLCERPRVVLVGAPNAGKSTLLNALCQADRAITHAQPGTTRDTLEAATVIDGTELTLVDTAGLRAPADPVEREAIERTRSALQAADVRLVLVDASRPLDEADRAALVEAGPRALRIGNKADLGVDASTRTALGSDALELSALTGAGLAALRAALHERTRAPAESLDTGWLVTVGRHAEQLDQAAAALAEATRAARAGFAEEVVAVELRRALQALTSVVGGDPTEDVLESVFRRFCIGK